MHVIKVFMFIVTLFTYIHYSCLPHVNVITDFKGPKVQKFDLQYHKTGKNILKSNIEEKMLKIMCLTIYA